MPLTAQTPVSETGQYCLQNKQLRLALAADGSLSCLEHKMTGHRYAGGTALWRLYIQEGSEFDIEIAANGQAPTITASDEEVEIHYGELNYRGCTLPIELSFRVRLAGDETRWEVRLANRADGIVVRECHFPLIGRLEPRPGQTLILTKDGGNTIPDLQDALSSEPSQYKAPDHLFQGMVLNYPYGAANNCYTFAGDQDGLYFGCHNTQFERTLQQFRLYPKTGLEAGFVRFPNLEPGQQWKCGEFVVAPYTGSWHVAARKYRNWADTWFQKVPAPAWVRRLNGWQRIIMQHQYGDVHYGFDQLSEIFADGHRAGIDCLFMFGWHRGGHDNNYPDYVPDPRLGSQEQLQAGIDHFNQNQGQVILYTSGRLIDRQSDFYRTGGDRLVIKDFWGNEIRESYRFHGPGNFVSEFANRTVLPVCPSCPEWFDVLKAAADQAADWNCRAFFMDQQGTSEYPCNDPGHDHPPLWMGAVNAKADTVRRLRDHLRSRDPEMALGIEILTDVTAQHADFIHNMTGAAHAEPGWEINGTKPQQRNFVEWFRYTFPEVILSDREIRDDSDIERRVNHAVLKGLRTDIEIYRCRKTIAETPHYADYLGKVNALRQRQAALLLEGRYVDTDGFSWDNPEIDARAFIRANPAPGEAALAIVLTQSHLKEATTTVRLDHAADYHLGAFDCVGSPRLDTKEADSPRLTLPRHALAVLVFQRS